ncbi:MAG: hypothetical protein M3Y54_22390 [Bacteroidota bacterium]|nr:hypothetical protein [Bacteroidota bacterium]
MKTPKKPCKHCGNPVNAGRALYCDDLCRKRASRKREVHALGAELVADVRRVQRLVEEEALPAEYSWDLDTARGLTKQLDVFQEATRAILDNLTALALLHQARQLDPVQFESGTGHLRGLVAWMLFESAVDTIQGFAKEAKQVKESVAETYSGGAIEEELESVLYARQIDHWWQADEAENKEGGVPPNDETGCEL